MGSVSALNQSSTLNIRDLGGCAAFGPRGLYNIIVVPKRCAPCGGGRDMRADDKSFKGDAGSAHEAGGCRGLPLGRSQRLLEIDRFASTDDVTP